MREQKTFVGRGSRTTDRPMPMRALYRWAMPIMQAHPPSRTMLLGRRLSERDIYPCGRNNIVRDTVRFRIMLVLALCWVRITRCSQLSSSDQADSLSRNALSLCHRRNRKSIRKRNSKAWNKKKTKKQANSNGRAERTREKGDKEEQGGEEVERRVEKISVKESRKRGGRIDPKGNGPYFAVFHAALIPFVQKRSHKGGNCKVKILFSICKWEFVIRVRISSFCRVCHPSESPYYELFCKC